MWSLGVAFFNMHFNEYPFGYNGANGKRNWLMKNYMIPQQAKNEELLSKRQELKL